MPSLDTPFFDFTPYWGFLIVVVMCIVVVMVIRGALASKDGKPNKLIGYVVCIGLVCFMLWMAANVVSISNSDSFNEVGRNMKIKAAPTTVR